MSTGSDIIRWWGIAVSALVVSLSAAGAQIAPKGELSLSFAHKAKDIPRDATKVFLSAWHGGQEDVMTIYRELAKLPKLQKLTIYTSFPEQCGPGWDLIPTYPALTELVVMTAAGDEPLLYEPIGKCEDLTSLHFDFG